MRQLYFVALVESVTDTNVCWFAKNHPVTSSVLLLLFLLLISVLVLLPINSGDRGLESKVLSWSLIDKRMVNNYHRIRFVFSQLISEPRTDVADLLNPTTLISKEQTMHSWEIQNQEDDQDDSREGDPQCDEWW